jgi:uncharacterized protein YjbI with pentapeptide repeats
MRATTLAHLADANLADADLTDGVLVNADPTGADLGGADFSEGARVPEGWLRDPGSGPIESRDG